MTPWLVHYASADALQNDAPTEAKPALDFAGELQLAAARNRAQRAIGAGIVRGDVAVTIACDAGGVVSVSLTTRPNG